MIVNETSYPNWIDIFNFVWHEIDHDSDPVLVIEECIEMTNKIYASAVKKETA